MELIVVFLSVVGLVVLVGWLKVDAFLAFIAVSVGAGLAFGVPAERLVLAMEKGVGDILGSLTLIIVLGAMLGKLVAESGAAGRIAEAMTGLFGVGRLRWGLMATGFVVGIPLFYGVGFVLMVPLIFTVAGRYRLPAAFVGLPMLAALSVTHGYLPPHPSPVALSAMFGADVGMTLALGLVVAIPAIVLAGPVFSLTLRGMECRPALLFEGAAGACRLPGRCASVATALLPVVLLMLWAVVGHVFPLFAAARFWGSAPVAMFISLVVATYFLGVRLGRSVGEVMCVCVAGAKDVSMILLTVAGSGIFRAVLDESGVSVSLAASLGLWPVHPLLLGWVMAALIRVCIGSATVSALTAGGVILPLAVGSGVNPSLMVLSLGAGSLFFSHVNDSGFWMFREYFGLSLRDTFRSWSLMETIVSVVGLGGVLILSVWV
ncbi:MAG: gluconate:H+ symporter [Tannerellaceae bacterium]|jgi:Gnt-I system high-affinity gluconate transporter|nr:gluconate:H+ symporter [Tannerellaceae bacterium]